MGNRGRVGVDLNLLSARIFANWNDPKAVIGNALTAYRSAENPRLGVEYVVQATEKEIERSHCSLISVTDLLTKTQKIRELRRLTSSLRIIWQYILEK